MARAEEQPMTKRTKANTKTARSTTHPIHIYSFQARAILDGTQTQMRCAITKMPDYLDKGPLMHPPKHAGPYFDAYCGESKTEINPRGMSPIWNWWTADDKPDPLTEIVCPYGQPGDTLWGFEIFQRIADGTKHGKIEYGAISENADVHSRDPPWELCLHITQTQSRFTLLVKNIRVERLHDISDADISAEGVRGLKSRDLFALRWNKQNDIRGRQTWVHNPWVWVLSFERVVMAVKY